MWNDPAIKLVISVYFRQAEDPETSMPKYEDVFKGLADVKYGVFTEDWEFVEPK